MQVAIDFLEEYKSLDKLCKDALSSNEGVTEYLRKMEKVPSWVQNKVANWQEEYRALKHLRWVRNKLTHEVGALTSGICTEEDLKRVTEFKAKMLRLEDPLALCKKVCEEEEADSDSEEEKEPLQEEASPAWVEKVVEKTKAFFKSLKTFFTGKKD